MPDSVLNKHQKNSARTREKIIEAAEKLYGSRSIDGVSLSEITVASGQKNRNALQYHFNNREGLLQAIIDKHSACVAARRENYFDSVASEKWSIAEAAARCLVMPIIDYIEANPAAENFVKIVSQITAMNRIGAENPSAIGLTFPKSVRLRSLLNEALVALPKREAQRRIYLAVNIAFHSIADIYRASHENPGDQLFAAKGQMIDQLICVLESFFAAPTRQ